MRLRILVSLFAALSAYSAPSADFFIANGGQFDPKYRFSLQAREFDALFGTGGVDYVVKGKAAGSYRVVFGTRGGWRRGSGDSVCTAACRGQTGAHHVDAAGAVPELVAGN
jgi:hypothetical protein